MYILVSPDNSIIAHQSESLLHVLQERAKGYHSYTVKEISDLKLIDYLKIYQDKLNFKVLFLVKDKNTTLYIPQDILHMFNNVLTSINRSLLDTTLDNDQSCLFINYVTNVDLNRDNTSCGTVDSNMEYKADLILCIENNKAKVIKCRISGCIGNVLTL